MMTRITVPTLSHGSGGAIMQSPPQDVQDNAPNNEDDENV